MQLKKNEIKIIKFLISSSDYVTSYDISKATDISRRSVREEMVNVKKILEKLGYELISKTSKGYLLNNTTKESIRELQDYITDCEKTRDSSIPTLPNDRQKYILKRLIESDDYIKLDELADEMLVSRSTVSGDLAQIKKDYGRYHLVLKQKPNYGIKVVANEIDLRRPLCDALFQNLIDSSLLYSYLDNFMEDHNSIEYSIIRTIDDYGINMNDIALVDFLINIILSMTRVITGHTITEFPYELKYMEDRIELEAAKKIRQYFIDATGVEFNDYEMYYYAILLMTKRSTSSYQFEDDDAKILTQNILKAIQEETLIEFKDYSVAKGFPFYTALYRYVYNALVRQHYREKIRTPIYKDVVTDTPLAYELSQITAHEFLKYTGQGISRSEKASFSSIFETAMLTIRRDKLKVLLVFGLAGTYVDYTKYKVLERFSNIIDFTNTTSYHNLSDVDLSKFDFVLSNFEISKELPIPHISISYLVTDNDLDKLDYYIRYTLNNDKLLFYMHPRLYIDHIKYKQKAKLIEIFYNIAKEVYPDLNDSLITSLKNHQYSYSNIEGTIGVVRLDKPITSHSDFLIMHLEEPIKFDNGEVQLLIITSIQEKNYYIYNSLFNNLNRIFDDPDTLDDYLDHPSYINFLKTFIVK